MDKRRNESPVNEDERRISKKRRDERTLEEDYDVFDVQSREAGLKRARDKIDAAREQEDVRSSRRRSRERTPPEIIERNESSRNKENSRDRRAPSREKKQGEKVFILILLFLQYFTIFIGFFLLCYYYRNRTTILRNATGPRIKGITRYIHKFYYFTKINIVCNIESFNECFVIMVSEEQ